MEKLTVYADPKMPQQRVYQVDEEALGSAAMDMLDSFRSAAFQHDLGIPAPGRQPQHNVPAQLQSIAGVGQIMFQSPNYVVYKRDDADWEEIDPKIMEVFANAFGEIKEVNIIEGSM